MKELLKLKKWLQNRLEIAQNPSVDVENIKWKAKAEAYQATIVRIEHLESETFSGWYDNLTDDEKKVYCKVHWYNKWKNS